MALGETDAMARREEVVAFFGWRDASPLMRQSATREATADEAGGTVA
jgi:hypothetical protein